MKLESLLVNGVSVHVLQEGREFVEYAYPHPTIVIPEGSEEIAALEVFGYLHRRVEASVLPEFRAATLFGLLRDNPAYFQYLFRAEPPLDIDLLLGGVDAN